MHVDTGNEQCITKNMNASRPSEHPPGRGENVKTFSWDYRLQIQNLFMVFKQVRNSPMVIILSQQYNTGEKPSVMLYTHINRHAGTPNKTKNKSIVVHNYIDRLILIYNNRAIDLFYTIKDYN